MTDKRVQEILEEFDWLEDWEDRYLHLIALGKALPALAENDYQDIHQVKGCVSRVWLLFDTGKKNILTIRGDSDAYIVKGLIALLIRLYTERSAQEILNIDAKALFTQLGFGQHLTPQRSNGFSAMVSTIREKAYAMLH